MKKQLFSFLLLITYLHGGDKIIKQLETDPMYVKAQQEVRLLKERFSAARAGAKRGAKYGAATGAVVGAPVGVAWAGEAIGEMSALGEYGKQIRAPYAAINAPARIVLPPVIVLTLGGSLMYSAAGTGVGAAVGASISETKRRYTLWKINSALQKYTPYTFGQLPLNESIMVLAAYQRNSALMKKIRPYIQPFLLRKGVWEVLAYLYYSSATPEQVHSLKELVNL